MKIAFASLPFDGHVGPMTGLAAHLAERGHEVRFYTGPSYAERMARLGVAHVPFERAEEITAENLVERFPEYETMGSGPKAIEFALTKIFFGQTEGHLEDLLALRDGFPFEALVCDGAFYAAYPLAKKLGVPTYVISAAPSPAPTSPSAPPPFFGLRPATNPFARLQHRVVRAMVEGSMKKGMRMFDELLARQGLPPYRGSIFDVHVGYAAAIFQTGCPGMDYPRDDWPERFEFVGALVPPRRAARGPLAFEDRLARAPSVVVVSQGTIDNRDPEKLFVPALTALAGGPHLVVACTGGRNTDLLRTRFPHDDVIVEDWVDFGQLLPHADVFVCNGGYGSIMQALVNGVPVLSAGKLEGKNDINARLAYRGLGIDLKTERPTPKAIASGVAKILADRAIAANVARVAEELASYRPLEIMESAIVQGSGAAMRRAS